MPENGVPWRGLPAAFGKRKTVYDAVDTGRWTAHVGQTRAGSRRRPTRTAASTGRW
ncbi:hypothetical protein DTL70_30610 [Streptomyces diacarni]|uniref:Transposase n=1 Tax=Streptomyces diacarni TaxID=2800381 RepID=A0A367ECD1_9ACTN|nr:hypothetical protein DTL70_30610 [Streptomyces diacarni]